MTAILERPRGFSHDPEQADHAAIAQCAAGRVDPARLTIAERTAVVRMLHGWSMNDQEIARQTGMSARNVLRIRYNRLGLPAIGAKT